MPASNFEGSILRVLTCLFHEHDLLLVALAALLCLIGSYVSVQLFRRTIDARGASRFHWCFLASVCAGASIWGTHFIAMLEPVLEQDRHAR